MKINAFVRVNGRLCALVPYRAEHVPRYHAWMQNEWIREMTASEPLTLEEEYAMQRSWSADDDKLTFIVLDRSCGDAMVGDVNVFYHGDDKVEGEIEVMIAEEGSRRKGIATEAVQLMMGYAAKSLGTRTFVAKILDHNSASLALFERLGFQPLRKVEVFRETHLRLRWSDEEAAKVELDTGEWGDAKGAAEAGGGEDGGVGECK